MPRNITSSFDCSCKGQGLLKLPKCSEILTLECIKVRTILCMYGLKINDELIIVSAVMINSFVIVYTCNYSPFDSLARVLIQCTICTHCTVNITIYVHHKNVGNNIQRLGFVRILMFGYALVYICMYMVSVNRLSRLPLY